MLCVLDTKATSLGNAKATSLGQDACHEFRTQVYIRGGGKTQVSNEAKVVCKPLLWDKFGVKTLVDFDKGLTGENVGKRLYISSVF